MSFWDLVGGGGLSNTHVVVLDFGSGSVKAAVMGLDIEKKFGTVRGFGKKHFDHNFSLATLPDVNILTECAREALTQATAMAKISPSECFVVLNGDLFKGMLSEYIETRSDNETRIDEKSFQDILSRAIAKGKEEIAKEYGMTDKSMFLVVEGAVERIEIDGYHIVNPLGFKGSKIMVKNFLFYLTKEHKQYWDSIIASLKLRNKGFVSSTFSSVQAQLKHTLTQFGAIFVDIGQYSTDVAMVRDSIMEGIKTFEVGGRAITEGIGDIFGISLEEAVEKKIKYEAGELSPDEARLIETGLRSKVDLLRQGVLVALREFPESVVGYPEKIYLYGGGVRAQIVKRMFSQGAWLSGLSFVKRPIIEVLLPTDIKDIIDETGLLSGPESVPLLSAVRWVTRHYRVTAQAEQLLRKAFVVQ